jgi:hypothetical protein
MDNQHRKISGYRDLTEAEVALMNKIKATGAHLEALLGELQMHTQAQIIEAVHRGSNERARLDAAQPARWLAIARTDFQTGLMAAVRAVAQPGNF